MNSHTHTQVSRVDFEMVQATALTVVFDLLHVYGFEAFEPEEGVGEHDLSAISSQDEVRQDLCLSVP